MSKLHTSIPIAQDSIEQPTTGLRTLLYHYSGDLNNCIHGITMCANCTNAPTTDWGLLICGTASSGAASIQVFFALRTNNIYRRWGAGGSWQSWVTLV